jgi:hypothetical protein
MGIIYCWKLGDQVVYIGRTIKTLNERSAQHILEYQKQIKKDVMLTKKFEKIKELDNGWDSITFETIEEVEDENLGVRERYWYEHYGKKINLWNAVLPPLNINYSEPIDIKDKMLNEFIKSQHAKIRPMFKNVRDLLIESWDYFSRHVGSIEVAPDVYEPNPNYNGEYLDFTTTLMNLLDEYSNHPEFSLLLKEVIEFYESDSEVDTKLLARKYNYKKQYESIESLMDESISSGEWYYGKPLKIEPSDTQIFYRFDDEFKKLIGNHVPAPNHYLSNPHLVNFSYKYVKPEDSWKYQGDEILLLNELGRSIVNHEWIYAFDKVAAKNASSDNFRRLMTYLRGKNVGKQTKYDRIHNRIETRFYDEFHEDIREAIFNKHFYKYDNDHHLNYINLVVPIIELHIKNTPSLQGSEFEFIDDIDRPEIDIHKYMVFTKG